MTKQEQQGGEKGIHLLDSSSFPASAVARNPGRNVKNAASDREQEGIIHIKAANAATQTTIPKANGTSATKNARLNLAPIQP